MNSGKIVTILTEDVTMGNWHGTGYIVTNPETGTGAYMISGGFNGGSLPETVDDVYLLGMIGAQINIALQMESLIGITELISGGIVFSSNLVALYGGALVISAVSTIVGMLNCMTSWTEKYYDYILSGDDEVGLRLMKDIANEMTNQYLMSFHNDIWTSIVKMLDFFY